MEDFNTKKQNLLKLKDEENNAKLLQDNQEEELKNTKKKEIEDFQKYISNVTDMESNLNQICQKLNELTSKLS